MFPRLSSCRPEDGVQVEKGKRRGTSRPRKLVFQETSRKENSLSWPVDHDFTQGLQHFPFIVLEVAVDLANTLLLDHPQLAVGFCDESGIVADDNHSFEKKDERVEGREEGGRGESEPERREPWPRNTTAWSPREGGGRTLSRLTALVFIDGFPESINRLDVQVIGGFVLRRRQSVTKRYSSFRYCHL